MNKRNHDPSPILPRTWSLEARQGAAAVTLIAAAGALAVGYAASQHSPKDVPAFATCTGTVETPVATTGDTYGDFAKDQTDFINEDGSVASATDIERILKGLEVNDDPGDESIVISVGAQHPAANSLPLYLGEPTTVPEVCVVHED